MQCCLANVDLDHNFEYKIIVAIPILIWEGEFSEKWVHVVYFKSHLPQATEKEHWHFEVEMLWCDITRYIYDEDSRLSEDKGRVVVELIPFEMARFDRISTIPTGISIHSLLVYLWIINLMSESSAFFFIFTSHRQLFSFICAFRTSA